MEDQAEGSAEGAVKDQAVGSAEGATAALWRNWLAVEQLRIRREQ